LISRLKNLLRWAKITGPGDTAGQFPVQPVTYLGKDADCLMLFPYGFYAVLTTDALVAMLAMHGQEENRAGLGYTPQTRPSLAEGEVAVYHPTTGTMIKLQADGDVLVSAPNVRFTGNVDIDGDLNVDGATTLSASVTSNGVNISDTHVHSGVQSGGSNTGAPV
jgi:phage baseplate assembly protein gpV